MSLPQLNPLIEMICKEKGVQRNIVIKGLEKAFATVAKKRTSYMADIKAEYTPEEDTIKLLRYRTVVEKVTHPDIEMTLAEGRSLDPEVEVGDELGVELNTKTLFTRNDIITISQMVKNGNLMAQKEVILNEFSGRKMELVTGLVKQIDSRGNVHVALGKTDGVIPRSELMQNDDIQVNTKIEAILLEVGAQHSLGDIILSRAHHMFAYRMLESECSDIADGTIHIVAIAREAGIRTKVVVDSDVEKDPVKVVVGNKGYHIQQLIDRMNGEKINVIGKSDMAHMLPEALAPGKYSKATIEDSVITIVVEDEDLGKIVGKRGANLRLAASVLNRKIDVISENKLREKTNNARKELDQLGLLSLLEAESILANKILGLNALSKKSAKEISNYLNGDTEKAELVIEKSKQLVKDLKLPEVNVVESFANPVEFEIPSKKNSQAEKNRDAILRQELKNSLNIK